MEKSSPRIAAQSSPAPLDKPYRVMLVDDHKFLVELLATRLDHDPKIKIVGLANRGSSAIHILKNEAVDIVLLDMELEDDDGINVAQKLFEINPDIRIIGLSVHDGDRYPMSLLELGGSGFLSKNATGNDIVEGITRVADGEMAISPKIAFHLATKASVDSPIIQLRILTAKEREVLKLIALGHRMLKIADVLGISEKTVHGHRSSIKKKLKATTDVELCLIALKAGLINIKETN